MNFLIELSLKATIILLVSALIIVMSHKLSAQFRHWIISLTFIILLILPVAVKWIPRFELPVPVHLSRTNQAFVESLSQKNQLSRLEQINEVRTQSTPFSDYSKKGPVNQHVEEMLIGTQHPFDKSSQEIATTAIPSSSHWHLTLFIIWLGISACFILRLSWGIIQVHLLAQKSIPFSTNQMINVPQAVKVVHHEEVSVPMTYSLFRPTILLPSMAKDWPKETIHAVLLHELAHIRRYDFWIHVCSSVSASLYWFHPLMWWIKHRQWVEREKACDEYVLKMGISPQNYATQLVYVAKNLARPIKDLFPVPMIYPSKMKVRVLAILSFNKTSYSFDKQLKYVSIILYMSGVVILTSFVPREIEPTVLANTKVISRIHQQQLSMSALTRSSRSAGITKEQNNPGVRLGFLDNSLKIKLFKEPDSLINKKFIVSRINVPDTDTSYSHLGSERSEDTAYDSVATRGKYVSWKSSTSEIHIWTYGNFRCLPDYPYLEVDSPKDMIIIKEKRNGLLGNKTYQLIITKAPYDGVLVHSYIDDNVNSFSGYYHSRDPLFLFSIDGEWGHMWKRKKKWIDKNLHDISRHLMINKSNRNPWKTLLQDDSFIKEQHEMKKIRYVGKDEVSSLFTKIFPEWWNEDTMTSLTYPKVHLNDFPVVSQGATSGQRLGIITKAGRQQASEVTTGGTAGGDMTKVGQKFGTIIRDIPETSLLKDLHFHLRFNDYDRIFFNLYLLKVEKGEIVHTLTKEPIRFNVSNKNPWVSAELENYQLVTEGDVLVVLELEKLEGKHKNGRLFFTHAKEKYVPIHKKYEEYWWEFTEAGFAFYFTVEH